MHTHAGGEKKEKRKNRKKKRKKRSAGGKVAHCGVSHAIGQPLDLNVPSRCVIPASLDPRSNNNDYYLHRADFKKAFGFSSVPTPRPAAAGSASPRALLINHIVLFSARILLHIYCECQFGPKMDLCISVPSIDCEPE